MQLNLYTISTKGEHLKKCFSATPFKTREEVHILKNQNWITVRINDDFKMKLEKIKEITKQETNSEAIRFVIDNYLSVLNKSEKSDSGKIEKILEQNETILKQNKIIMTNNETVNGSIDRVVDAVKSLHNYILKITTK